MNYSKIDELFGAPLNQVPRPHKPFQVKPWHVAVVLVAGVLVYKGCQKLNEDFLNIRKNKFMVPIKLKEDKKD